ncbi:hypothetical protein [Curtobacterium sp. VKM Ac-1393]|uniref:hypothetical protein n=1 Tax=Curtobacterium sp. VKM Ac-1393 TaxID=2783814 RepID=UPI001889DF33|nr:hypothetical protein [Curtobacterium sp. VKM Ac-1393]MBF4606419.1 hypothetical protein [Curtobacterium sp. VKM Ac-1393]
MSMLMQERFQEAAAPFVEFGGHTVWAIHDLPPVPLLRIHFQSANGERTQGIGLEAKGSPKYPNGAGDAWTGNFGMLVERDEGGLSFRCSDGLGEAAFTDLVFRVETVVS